MERPVQCREPLSVSGPPACMERAASAVQSSLECPSLAFRRSHSRSASASRQGNEAGWHVARHALEDDADLLGLVAELVAWTERVVRFVRQGLCSHAMLPSVSEMPAPVAAR